MPVSALAEHLADAEADKADERGRVHAEADLGGAVRIDQKRNALARLGHRLVHLDAAAIAPAALDIVVDEMAGHGIQHAHGGLPRVWETERIALIGKEIVPAAKQM